APPAPPAKEQRAKSPAAKPAKPSTSSKPSTSGSRPPEADGLPQSATDAQLAALEPMTKDGVWEIGARLVPLSNLDKVLFPEPGFTKRDLIRYYATIAPTMLPY